MACGSCGKAALRTIRNLGSIAKQSNEPFKWILTGVKGIIKCIEGKTIYSDEEIQRNRDVCRQCEFATKTDGKLTLQSQCMAPDPKMGGQPCGCFITCKTQVDVCPLGKFTNLTISSV